MTGSQGRKLGLIAGAGKLPLRFARLARKNGYSLATVAVKGAAPPALIALSDSIQWVSLGQIGSLLSFFKRQGVRETVMHGKVSHASLFKGLRLDFKTISLWASLKDRSGEGLLKCLAGELGKNGIEVLDARWLMKDLLAPRGVLTKSGPSREDERAGRYGLERARAAAKMRIGQTVLVKKSAVVAVEAMEGTDQAVRRAGKLAGPGVILAKASSPRQDWRFDVPTIGIETIQALAKARAKGLVVEAGKVFFLDKEKSVLAAEKNGLFILAV